MNHIYIDEPICMFQEGYSLRTRSLHVPVTSFEASMIRVGYKALDSRRSLNRRIIF